MKWPLARKSVPASEIAFFNHNYLCAAGASDADPTIVWTSEIEWENVVDHVQRYQQQHARMISTTHVLVQAIGQSLAAHPKLNRRVVGRNVHAYNDCHVCLGTRVPGDNEVYIIQVHDADTRPLYQIAYIITAKQLEFARKDSRERRDLARLRNLPGWLLRLSMRLGGWLDQNFVLPVTGRIDRLRESGVLVNDFSSNRFPTMRGYKPSRQPGGSKPISVTLGRPEEKLVMVDDVVTNRLVAPITVRIDHRIGDSFQLAQFVKTIVAKLNHPAEMEAVATNAQADLEPDTAADISSLEISHRQAA